MKKIILCLLVVVLLLSSVGCQSNKTQGDGGNTTTENIVSLDFLASSDFAGSIEATDYYAGSAKFAAYIQHLRDQNPDGTFVMDCGDALVGTPVSNLQNGRPVVDVMNLISYDVMNIGNHEFDWGMDITGESLKQAKFPIVCANVKDSATNNFLDFAKPYVIIEKKGVKVGILGLVTKETPSITRRTSVENYTFIDPILTTNELVPEMREKGAEIIVALTHLPAYLQDDGTFAGEVIDYIKGANDVDVVIAGHNFDAMATVVDNIPIFQTTHNGSSIGHIHIEYNPSTKNIVSQNVELVEVKEGTLNVTPDKNIESVVLKNCDKLGDVFNRKIGTAEEELTIGYVDEFSIGNWWTDAICHETGAQIAFINSSGIFETIPQGDITLGKIYTVSPFDNYLVTTQMNGEQLKKLFEISYDSTRIQEYGALQISGMIVEYDLDRPDYDKVVSMKLSDGTQITNEGTYTVATIDFLATGGNGYDNLVELPWDQTGILARDSYVKELTKIQTLSNDTQGRLVDLKH